MADNYLENKMEEHRRGGAAPYRRHLTPTGNKPGTAVFGTEVNLVLLEGQERLGEYLEAVARRFKSTGARVAFRCSDKGYGTRFAQENSLVFIPSSAAVPETFATPHFKASADSASGLTVCAHGCEYTVDIASDDTPAAIADALLLLSLPAFAFLRQKVR